MHPTKMLVIGALLVAGTLLAFQATSQDAAPEEAAPEIGSITPLRGLDLAVRGEGEAEFTEKTKRTALEAYRDEDFGTLVYVTGDGSVAATPQPANFELRHLPFESFYESIRFSPIAGVAWRLNLRTATWQLIGEPGPLTPGTYDIDLFHVTADSMVAMRIDQLTGRTWTLVSEKGKPDRWQPIAEPAVDEDEGASGESDDDGE